MRTGTMASLSWTLWTWTFGSWNSCTRTSWISLTWFSTPLLAAALGVLLPTAAEASILITIDKNSQQMSVAADGAERYTWPVSTGRPGYDTPSGAFKPNRMDADHYSQEWDNAPMPHSIFFDMEGHAIHGFFDVKHLGSAVSHGCVRLSPEHATTLFDEGRRGRTHARRRQCAGRACALADQRDGFIRTGAGFPRLRTAARLRATAR
jgi:L,D-transpeptidase catalytic domain